MLFTDKVLQDFYNRLLDKGADRVVLDNTMASDVHGNYNHIKINNPKLSMVYLRSRYKTIIQSIKSNQTCFLDCLNTKVYI